jgi:hypothetical protein
VGAGHGPRGQAARHNEGYLEAFAVIYSDIAEAITARLENKEPDPAALAYPTVEDGARGVTFITAAVESSLASLLPGGERPRQPRALRARHAFAADLADQLNNPHDCRSLGLEL